MAHSHEPTSAIWHQHCQRPHMTLTTFPASFQTAASTFALSHLSTTPQIYVCVSLQPQHQAALTNRSSQTNHLFQHGGATRARFPEKSDLASFCIAIDFLISSSSAYNLSQVNIYGVSAGVLVMAFLSLSLSDLSACDGSSSSVMVSPFADL
ncbi:hypothetical protein Micbo1qcDRAFT_166520 [Microdochium bolleyi]|uniref:Uncharacterized protein n=1 Tax=Microdochium bolleyi TaxID=196109 RepID=A0A136IU55_9PEZI|nr:hypothetical protein Micbo1qcDRAFT_166520 [Microdochium bolleyi]